MERDPKRRFSKHERIALANAADWKSELSGLPLDEHFHVDHIYPHSMGGRTELVNAQLLTPQENLRKGNSVTRFSYEQLRNWQQRFVDAFRKAERRDFMLAAVPGSGKTIASLYCLKEFLDSGSKRRALIVVPTDHLREQWRDEAYRVLGLSLQTEFSGRLGNDFAGLITTYQALARSPVNFRAVVSRYQFMGIGDEVHHLSDKEHTAWGTAFKDVFSCESVSRLLLTSGTPLRTDGERIPFLRLKDTPNEDGSYDYHVDARYDYPAAIRDRVLRRVTFTRYWGQVDLLGRDGQPFSLNTDDEVSERLRQLRLLRLIQREEYAKGLLEEADSKLTELRRKQPRAGGLVLCIDSNHAKTVSRWLKEITGEWPHVVVDNPDIANSTVSKYKDSDHKWIVAVRMVAEGVDIPRLGVLAYLTNWSTNLFFRQAIGRIIRHGGTKREHAYCFIPSDPLLSQFATTIEDFQALVPEDDDTKPATRKTGERGDSDPAPILTVGASGPEFDGMVVGGESFDAETSSVILEAAQAANISPDEAATAFAIFTANSERQTSQEIRHQEEHPEDHLKRLRKECARMTVALGFQQKVIDHDMTAQEKSKSIARLTNWVSKQSSTPNPKDCALEDIRQRHQWLLRQIQNPTISH